MKKVKLGIFVPVYASFLKFAVSNDDNNSKDSSVTVIQNTIVPRLNRIVRV